MMTILELSLIASAPLLVSAVGQEDGNGTGDPDGNGTGDDQLRKHHAHQGWKHHPNRHHHGHHASLFKAAANKWNGIFTAQCDLALSAIKMKDDGSGPDLNDAGDTQTEMVIIPGIVRARNADGTLQCPEDSGNACQSRNKDFNITALCAGGLLVQQWENLNEVEKKYFKQGFLAQFPQKVQDELTDDNIKEAWAQGAKDAFYACEDLDESTDPAARKPVKFYVSDGQTPVGAIHTVIGFEARKFCKGILFAGHIWEYVHGDENMDGSD